MRLQSLPEDKQTDKSNKLSGQLRLETLFASLLVHLRADLLTLSTESWTRQKIQTLIIGRRQPDRVHSPFESISYLSLRISFHPDVFNVSCPPSKHTLLFPDAAADLQTRRRAVVPELCVKKNSTCIVVELCWWLKWHSNGSPLRPLFAFYLLVQNVTNATRFYILSLL